MKATNVEKMTNRQLARKLKRYVTAVIRKEFPAYAATLDEAARRLRWPTAVDLDMMRKLVRDIDTLRLCLKDAESAVKGLLGIVCIDCRSEYRVDGTCVKCNAVADAESALETIRAKGGLK